MAAAGALPTAGPAWVMATACDRWPVYLRIPAVANPRARTHSRGARKSRETHGAPQETPPSRTLTRGSIIAAGGVFGIFIMLSQHAAVSAGGRLTAELFTCGAQTQQQVRVSPEATFPA